MAEFEELKLTVNLVDNASTGLVNLRTQMTQLIQTAGQVQTAFSGVATSVQEAGKAHQQATPHVSNQEKALKELARSSEETTRGILQMALASRQGLAGFAAMALGAREAMTGLQGVNAGMAELGSTARLMVVGLGSVALGVAAVGAAVAAYGISVFKFSREMYTLGQSAKSLGLTLGTLKDLTEQNVGGLAFPRRLPLRSLGNCRACWSICLFSGSKVKADAARSRPLAKMAGRVYRQNPAMCSRSAKDGARGCAAALRI